MISDAGATLIATVYPIALLIVAVNRRSLEPRLIRTGLKRTLRIVLEIILSLAIVAAVASIAICVVAVCLNIPIHNEWLVLCILLSGIVLGGTSLSVLQSLGLDAATQLLNGRQSFSRAPVRGRPTAIVSGKLRRRARG